MADNEKALFEAGFHPGPDRMAEAYRVMMPLWQKILLNGLGALCLIEAAGQAGVALHFHRLEQVGFPAFSSYWILYRPLFLTALFLLLGAGCFALCHMLPALRARKFCGALRLTNGGQAASYTYVFENDGFRVGYGEKEPVFVTYGELRIVRETKRLILLQAESKEFFCVDRASVTGGDTAAFLVFLEEKAPRATFWYGVKR